MVELGLAVSLLDATLLAGTPLLLAGLGELISEKSGVLNLGVEGIMLVGALTAFASTVVTGNPYLGVIVAIGSGVAMAAIHAYLCISLKSDQVISGVMLTLLGMGLTTYFGRAWVEKSTSGFGDVTVPLIGTYLVELPLGSVLFERAVLDYVAIVLVVVVWLFLNRTNLGLEIASVGEDPETADSVGISVFRLRYLCVLVGGAFAGIAGAHISLVYANLWVSQIVSGRGWIAIALVIFAQWRPIRLLAGAYLFGFIDALQLRSQAFSVEVGTGIPFSSVINGVLGFVTDPLIMSTYPYLVTILVLVIVTRGTGKEQMASPSALLQSYSREHD
jgi:simple sugar transport system permease protein